MKEAAASSFVSIGLSGMLLSVDPPRVSRGGTAVLIQDVSCMPRSGRALMRLTHTPIGVVGRPKEASQPIAPIAPLVPLAPLAAWYLRLRRQHRAARRARAIGHLGEAQALDAGEMTTMCETLRSLSIVAM